MIFQKTKNRYFSVRYLLTSIFIAFLILMGLTHARAASETKSITIGFQPGGDAEVTKQAAVVVAEALQAAMGISVNVYLSKDYSGLISAMKAKKVDFAFFSALTYVLAEKEVKAKVLLKTIWEGPFYYSGLFVRDNSKIKTVKDLKGKTIAFVDPKSTSGYMYPMAHFLSQKMSEKDFKKVVYSGSHANSVKLLENGEVDVIAVFSDDTEGIKTAYAKYQTKKEKARGIWFSSPIPNDPFAVRQDLYESDPKLVHSVMFELIDVMEKLKDNSSVKSAFGGSSLMPATTKQYQPVRDLLATDGLKIQIK